MTPNQTAVIFAPGSANKIGATIGTTTTAISIKSRKKPSKKITSITTKNCVQNPPGKPVRKCFTNSSPPKPRNAAVNMAAPSKMINTMDVVLAVSSITPLSVSSVVRARRPDQNKATRNPMTATEVIATGI